MNTMTNIRKTWYVGSGGHKYYPCGHVVCRQRMCIFNTSLHICSAWLITKKANIQSSVWATVMKLGMWVVVGTSTTHMVCHHQMRMFNTSFAYLF